MEKMHKNGKMCNIFPNLRSIKDIFTFKPLICLQILNTYMF